MTKNSLQCVDLGYSIEGRALFSGLNIDLKSGDLMVLQGRNGSGKTTLLRLLAGILSPASGSILLDNNPLNHEYNVNKRLYIGHKNALRTNINILENITLWSKLLGSPELCDAAIRYFDLEPYLDLPVEALSAGWQRRVSLTRLVMSQARLWLLDEPTSHLDEEGIGLLEALIASRKEQGGMIIMSLHGKVDSKDIKILNINDL